MDLDRVPTSKVNHLRLLRYYGLLWVDDFVDSVREQSAINLGEIPCFGRV